MNRENSFCIVIILCFVWTSICAQQEKDSLLLDAEKAKAEHFHKTAKILYPISLAESIAIKSWKVEDENLQGLLAKEAYEINKSCGGNSYNSYIYEGIYKATLKLQEKSKNNPHFNTLNQLPSEVERIGRIRAIKISSDNTKIYSIGSEGYLLDWAFRTYGSQKERDAKENKPTILSKSSGVSRTLDISPDGKYLAFAGDDGNIKLFDINKGKIKTDIVFNPHKGKRIWSLEFLPNSNGFISIGDDGLGKATILYTDMLGVSRVLVKQTEFKVTKLSISNDASYVATVGKSAQVHMWNTQTGKCEMVLDHSFADRHATAVAINPQGRFVAVGYQDGTLMIWDIDEYLKDKSYKPERLLYHSASISDLDFSKDGSMLVTGSLDKTASLCIVRNLAKKGEGGYKEFPYQSAKFQPIKFEGYDAWVTSVAFSNDGSKVVTGCDNGIMKIWETEMSVYAEQLCELAGGKNLSDNEWRKYIGTDDIEGKQLYLLMVDEKRRTPLSTCGSSAPQRVNK